MFNYAQRIIGNLLVRLDDTQSQEDLRKILIDILYLLKDILKDLES
jgi:hypothetical protein